MSPVAFAVLLVAACGGDFKVGSPGDGGAAPGSGGNESSGGRSGSGGGSSKGGSATSGGSLGAGGKGGSVGSGGLGGTGGAAPGGTSSAGGTPSTGGVASTGGITASGGITSSGGLSGTGGAPMQCVPGSLQCDHVPPRRCTDAGLWKDRVCGPLLVADLAAIDATKLPGFNQPGFRCKSLAVCGVSQNCIYYSQTLGSLESAEVTYTDGQTLAVAEAVKVSIAGGAASQCGDPKIDVGAGESIFIKTATGETLGIFFPAFSAQSITLYVREDGATFYDAALTQRAQGPG